MRDRVTLLGPFIPPAAFEMHLAPGTVLWSVHGVLRVPETDAIQVPREDT